jgi:hypothetical protein
MSLSVRGALKNMTKAEMKRMASCITIDDVPLKSADEVKDFLLDQLSQGHEKIPYGDCNNFDWKKGCLGHATEDANHAK